MLGGSFDTLEGRRIFCAPYIYSRFSPDISGVFEHAVIVGKGVKLRSGPSMSAAVLAELAYDIVEIEPDGPASRRIPWVKVRAGDKQGFVAAASVRRPLDYRACFEKKGGRWLLIALVAGD
ncbi:MAG: SH3 domain-containing protein [Acidobacteria bacterium]|nr:SH3 domain-containing protein [Acidobacteriota bacterium]